MIPEAHEKEITCISGIQERFFVTGGNDRKLVIWNGENFDILKVIPFEHPEEFVKAVIVFKG